MTNPYLFSFLAKPELLLEVDTSKPLANFKILTRPFLGRFWQDLGKIEKLNFIAKMAY